MKRVRHVVFSHYKSLTWWFKDTEHPEEWFIISLNPKYFGCIVRGLFLLIPPLKVKHIYKMW